MVWQPKVVAKSGDSIVPIDNAAKSSGNQNSARGKSANKREEPSKR